MLRKLFILFELIPIMCTKIKMMLPISNHGKTKERYATEKTARQKNPKTNHDHHAQVAPAITHYILTIIIKKSNSTVSRTLPT
jgi:hypothetical protein